LNARTPHTGISARLKSDGGIDDAVLKVAASEGVPEPKSQLAFKREVEWILPISVSASLVKRDGTVIWSEHAKDYSYVFFSREQTPEDVWKNLHLHSWAEEWVGQAVVSEMLYGVTYK